MTEVIIKASCKIVTNGGVIQQLKTGDVVDIADSEACRIINYKWAVQTDASRKKAIDECDRFLFPSRYEGGV